MLLRLRMLLLFGETEVIECLLGLASVGVGLWFALPANQSATGVPPYQAVLSIAAPLYVWGGLFILFGTVRLLAVLLDYRPARRWMALGAAMLWAGATAVLALSDTRYPSVPPYLIFALASLWVFFRRCANRRLFPLLEADQDDAVPVEPEG